VTPERLAAEERAAQHYARAIQTNLLDADFWRALNVAIIARWSVTALNRIKRRAWQIVDER
jgi:hypothetical protein